MPKALGIALFLLSATATAADPVGTYAMFDPGDCVWPRTVNINEDSLVWGEMECRILSLSAGLNYEGRESFVLDATGCASEGTPGLPIVVSGMHIEGDLWVFSVENRLSIVHRCPAD